MNDKLTKAIEDGNKINIERINAENEKTIAFQLKQLLKDDHIYKMISEAIGQGKNDLQLYYQGWIDDPENAGWACSAINRIENLKAEVKYHEMIFSSRKEYYVHITWKNNYV